MYKIEVTKIRITVYKDHLTEVQTAIEDEAPKGLICKFATTILEPVILDVLYLGKEEGYIGDALDVAKFLLLDGKIESFSVWTNTMTLQDVPMTDRLETNS
jgi:hypothetical protein